jgi:hypothetical protein
MEIYFLVWGPRYIGFGVVCVGGMNRITQKALDPNRHLTFMTNDNQLPSASASLDSRRIGALGPKDQ